MDTPKKSLFPYVPLYPTREEKKIINFVMTACAKGNDRPILMGIYVDTAGGQIVAADGFRLHLAKMPKCIQEIPELQNKIIRFINKPRISDVVWLAEILGDEHGIDRAYPEYMAAIPKDNPRYAVGFSNRLFHTSFSALASALSGDMLHFQIRKYDQPLVLEPYDNDYGLKAVVMPAHPDSEVIENTEVGAAEVALQSATKKIRELSESLDYLDIGKRVKQVIAGATATDESPLMGDALKLEERYRAFFAELVGMENRVKDTTKAQEKVINGK